MRRNNTCILSSSWRMDHPQSKSTISSTSSTSDERKPTAKFGSASPQAVRKLLALSEQTKTRPHQPRQPPLPPGFNAPQHSPAVRRAPSSTGSYSSYGSSSSCGVSTAARSMHERSHSDTPTPLPSVALSAESSSVTSLNNLLLRKTLTSGSVAFSDSSHSTNSSAGDGPTGLPHYYQSQARCPSPSRHPPSIAGAGRRQPPAYSVAAQMARLHRLGCAHSHEGVTQGFHYHTDPDTDHDEEETQVSAV
ncbi:hypothetical protein RN001_010588 [Aquatica leii]|uniref:Uncharacterized protein n=1 Tax=Aquatica leii TaxID=1421715 RepID=A0AAN7P6S7_9COLE|nr:hypothetical protein RN001_010588 [Aquatica leii]